MFHRFKRRAVAGESEQLVLLIEQEEDREGRGGKRRKTEKKERRGAKILGEDRVTQVG